MVICFQRIGGGVALLYASKELEKLPTANFDQKIGVQIIQNALKVSNFYYFILVNNCSVSWDQAINVNV